MPETTTNQGEDSLEELVSALSKHAVFKSVSKDVLRQLLKNSQRKQIQAGDYIFHQDEPASSLIIFVKGLAVQYKRTGGMECLIDYYRDMSVLGESSFLESSNRSTSLYANDDCLILEIEGVELRKLGSVFPEEAQTLTSNLGREVGRKVSTVNEKLHKAAQASLIRDTEVNWDLYKQ